MKTTLKWISPHWYLGCDQRCQICYLGAFLDAKVCTPMHERIRAIDALASYNPEEYFICGGNPTLDPLIEQSVFEIKSRGVAVEVLSNSWVMPHVLDKPRFLENIDDRALTVFGSDAKMHDTLSGAVPGSFKRLHDNVYKLSKEGYDFVPIINIMPGNKDSVYDIIKNLRKFIKFDRLWVQRIMPYGNALAHDDLFLSANDINPVLEQMVRAEEDLKLSEISFDMGAPLCLADKKYHYFMEPYKRGISFFALDWNGRLFGESFHLARQEYALLGGRAVWNVEGDLISAIEGDPVMQKIHKKEYLPEECKACGHYSDCFGGYPVLDANGRLAADIVLSKNFAKTL